MEEVRQAVGMPVDIFDVRHIEKGLRLIWEIISGDIPDLKDALQKLL